MGEMKSLPFCEKAKRFLKMLPPTARTTFNADMRGVGLFGGWDTIPAAFLHAKQAGYYYAASCNILFVITDDGYVYTGLDPSDVIKGW